MQKEYSNYTFLLECLQNGDEDAFEYLYATSRNRLFALANSIIDDEEAAKDLVQEFFAEFLQTSKFRNVEASLKTYLYTSIRNRSLKYIREKAAKNKKQNDLQSYLEIVDFEQNIHNLEQQLDQQNLSAEIERRILDLPPMARKVFIMHYIQTISHAGIAEKLNISKNTVSNHINRALKELREHLKKNLR